MTKYHKSGGFTNRNVLSWVLGWKPGVMVSLGFVPSEGREGSIFFGTPWLFGL